jgi:hypothetical protein
MIYGCDSDFVYLTNPLEVKSIDFMMKELTSDSILLVRSLDVIKRFNANPTNLIDLLLMKNHSLKEKKRWFDLNVLGQVVSVLRCLNECKLLLPNANFNIFSYNSNNDQPPIEILDLNNQDGNSSTNNVTLNINEVNYLYEANNVNLSNPSQQPSQLSPGSSGTSTNTNSSTSNPTRTHIAIPASYVPGISLFAYKDSNLFKEILEANELPLSNKQA